MQVAVGTKANEIVSAPLLLGPLDLKGMLITADAMFTQRALSIQIVEGAGDYLWSVKDKQPPCCAISTKVSFVVRAVQRMSQIGSYRRQEWHGYEPNWLIAQEIALIPEPYGILSLVMVGD